MVVVDNDIIVRAPAEKVYAFLAQPENLALWNHNILSVDKISSGTTTVGSSYRAFFKRHHQRFTVTSLKQNSLIEFSSGKDDLRSFKRQLTVESKGHQTRLTDHFEVGFKPLRVIQWLFRRSISNAVYANLMRLKQLLETGETTLQDGRVSTI